MKRKIATNVFLLIGIASAVFALLYQEKIASTSAPKAPPPEDSVTVYLIDASIRSYDESGKLKQQLNSTSNYRFSQKSTADTSEPELIIYDNDEIAWEIAGKSADTNPDNQQILLRGNVRVKNPRQNFDLTTDQLLLEPDKGFASTDTAVKLGGNYIQTRAIGMELNLNDGKYRLLNKVRATYEKN